MTPPLLLEPQIREKSPLPFRGERTGVADNRVGLWTSPAVIAPNNFVYKSLSNWAFNVAVGCSHACRFCYVPSAASLKQAQKLAEYGVKDPDVERGSDETLRIWAEGKLLASLIADEDTFRVQLEHYGKLDE